MVESFEMSMEMVEVQTQTMEGMVTKTDRFVNKEEINTLLKEVNEE
jgi:hypothetical protein